jgi:50S ribosomal protein L16 3-hydroxylase
MRVPARDELARSVLQCALDETEPPEHDVLYRDAQQPATREPGRIPSALAAFAADAVARFTADPQSLACALGEVLSEPKPRVWFDAGGSALLTGGVRLDRRSRMLYDEQRIYLNGESYRAGGRDARAMRSLADRRRLDAPAVARLSGEARRLLGEWASAGWVHDETAPAAAGHGARAKRHRVAGQPDPE